jgi:hypothetical protein
MTCSSSQISGWIERLLRRMVTSNPSLNRFVPMIQSDGSIDRLTLESAVPRGFCVVRWHLDDRRAS